MREFNKSELKKLYQPKSDSKGEQNGQVTIIGGSKLFHGSPLFALKSASRIVDMLFFASPEPSLSEVAAQLKSKLFSFVWVPWQDVEKYIEKSDAVLIGPGFMRYRHELGSRNADKEFGIDGKVSRSVTKHLLSKFPGKKWVIDAGSLQVMEPEWIPGGAIVTPNNKEFEKLFGCSANIKNAEEMVKKYNCTIVLKGPESFVCSATDSVLIKGGNAGMTKGGTGDVLAGLTVGLLAKNEPLLAACSASYIEKAAADELYKKVGVNYNADDLANILPEVFFKLMD